MAPEENRPVYLVRAAFLASIPICSSQIMGCPQFAASSHPKETAENHYEGDRCTKMGRGHEGLTAWLERKMNQFEKGREERND